MNESEALDFAKSLQFTDGLTNVYSELPNRRNAVTRNVVTSSRLGQTQLREIYRSGLGSKIVRLKGGYAMNDTLQFKTEGDRDSYELKVEHSAKKAARFMIAFGRAIVVVQQPGDTLRNPLRGKVDPATYWLRVFSGDMVTASDIELDLGSPRYLKPKFYQVRGEQIHYSRVVDFTYVEPVDDEAPYYQYGGISEFELINDQLVADGVVQRASPAILEKNSTLFYKVKGFKTAMATGKEADMVKYFQILEEGRSIYGAGLLDAEDEVKEISQALSNLSEADQITLRRLAMVTGIPLSILVGEQVKGLNSSGDGERQAFQDMIETLQSDYLLRPLNELGQKIGLGRVAFKDNQGETAEGRVEYESTAVETAFKLWQMGEDYSGYLQDKGFFEKDAFTKVFPE